MAAQRKEPPKDKLDESSVSDNLQSILDRIDKRTEVDPRAERYQGAENPGEPAFHPEVDRADYFMGIFNTDPAYCPKALFPHGMPQPMELLHAYKYTTGNDDQFFHKIKTAPTPAVADTFKRHWQARAAKVMKLWQSVKNKMEYLKNLDGVHVDVFSADSLASIFGTHETFEWHAFTDLMMFDILRSSATQGPAPPTPSQHPVDVQELGDLKFARMPLVNRPDVDAFSRWLMQIEIGHPDMPGALRPIHNKYSLSVPHWLNYIDKEPEDGLNNRSRTRNLEWYVGLWAPIINMENCFQPGNFVSLLYHRAKHHPATFASRDFEASYIARASRMDDLFNYHFLPSFWEVNENDHYIAHVDAPADGDTFNKAVVGSIQAKNRLYSHLEMGCILHTQEIIYEFISRTLDFIGTVVNEAGLTTLANMKGPDASDTSVDLEKRIEELNAEDLRKARLRDGDGDNRNELVHTWAVRQYAAPGDTLFDFDECEVNLLLMREQARNRLRELMTDPMAFLNEAKNIIDHHPGQIESIYVGEKTGVDVEFENTTGRQVTRHFDTDKVKKYGKIEAARLEDELLSSVLHTMVLAAVRELEIWDHLYMVAERLGDHIRTEQIDLHDPETPLEGELRKLWLLLLHSLRANHRHLYLDFQHNNSYFYSPRTRHFVGRFFKEKEKPVIDERGMEDPASKKVYLVNNAATRNYRKNGLKKHKSVRGPDGDWELDDSILYCPNDKTMTRWVLAFNERFNYATDDNNISRTLFHHLLKGEFLSYAGMSNLCEHVSRMDAKMDPKERRMTPYVWRQIQDMVTLSRMVDDMERTRRVPPPQAQRLRQEFEEDWGDLSSHVFGPSKYLPELSARMFIPDKLLNDCKPLRGLLYPLLRSIDKGLPRDGQNCLVPDKEGWDRVTQPQNRQKDLMFAWKHALSGIVGASIEDVFEGTNNTKINRGIKKMTTGINQGTFGVGLARFLSTFETGGKKKNAEAMKARQAAQDALEDEEEIAALKQLILRRSDALERATMEADGEWEDVPGDPMDVDRSEEQKPPMTAEEALAADEEHRRRVQEEEARRNALRPQRNRAHNSNYQRRRRMQLERQGQQNLLTGPAAAPPPIVKQPLHRDHWECFQACFGGNDLRIKTDFQALIRALGAINYNVRPTVAGSGWRFSWTPASNLPPTPGAISMLAHEPHGSALRNLQRTMLNIGARLSTVGITARRLARYYEGAPEGW